MSTHYDAMGDAAKARRDRATKVTLLRELALEFLGDAEGIESTFLPGPNSTSAARTLRDAAESMTEKADELEAEDSGVSASARRYGLNEPGDLAGLGEGTIIRDWSGLPALRGVLGWVYAGTEEVYEDSEVRLPADVIWEGKR